MSDDGTPSASITANEWSELRRLTPARLALGRVGSGMPTAEVLAFGWAHAMARDAIHSSLDLDKVLPTATELFGRVEVVASAAATRQDYLRRPDLGRMLTDGHRAHLAGIAEREGPVDCCFVIGDGLSSLAVERQAAPLLRALAPLLPEGLRIAPVVVATQARVALSDDIGEALRARLAVMLIGERPGLSSPDSLGIYITYGPRRGRSDAERNCISNVRPGGLGFAASAGRLAWLMRESLRRGLTGVGLKDESDIPLLDAGAARPRIA